MSADSDRPSLASLEKALAAATRPRESASVHEALAVYWGRRLEYRKMNHHELASAEAHGEIQPKVAEALALYKAGIQTFGSDDAKARELVRRARQFLAGALGTLHPQVIQVTNTLAGRLSACEDATETQPRSASSCGETC